MEAIRRLGVQTSDDAPRGEVDVLSTAAEDLLPSHPSTDTGLLDTWADGPLVFYSLAAADCGENESFGP